MFGKLRSRAVRKRLVLVTAVAVAVLLGPIMFASATVSGPRVRGGLLQNPTAQLMYSRPRPVKSKAASPITALSRYIVDNMATRTYPGDPQFFDGQWVSGDMSCWDCSTGPGVAAAVISREAGSAAPHYRRLAEQTFTNAIDAYRLPSGAFSTPTPEGDGIATIFFGVALGEAYLEIGQYLDPSTAALWRRSLAGAATYLVTEGHILTYYVNGNINLQATELLYDAWRATASRRLHSDYEKSWAFTLHPGPHWSGFGLRITRPYTTSNGSNGAGYLAESGGGYPGFDVDYSQLQADEAARLYLFSRDPRALRLLNLLTNQLFTRKVRGHWTLSTAGGTRHAAPNRFIPFTSSALAVLAWLGGRSDLRHFLPQQLGMLRTVFCGGLTYSYHNVYRSVGNELSIVLAAAQRAGRSVPASGLSSRIVCPALSPKIRRELIS